MPSFTLRIQNKREGYSNRRVYSCLSYKVEYLESNQMAKVRLSNGVADEAVQEVVLCNGETGYVMNERGFTVDVIRTSTK